MSILGAWVCEKKQHWPNGVSAGSLGFSLSPHGLESFSSSPGEAESRSRIRSKRKGTDLAPFPDVCV